MQPVGSRIVLMPAALALGVKPMNSMSAIVTLVVFAIAATAAVAGAGPLGFVMRQDANQVVIVDLADGSVRGTIATPDMSPFEIAVSPDGSTLYVTTVVTATVDTVDTLDADGGSPARRVQVGGTRSRSPSLRLRCPSLGDRPSRVDRGRRQKEQP